MHHEPVTRTVVRTRFAGTGFELALVELHDVEQLGVGEVRDAATLICFFELDEFLDALAVRRVDPEDVDVDFLHLGRFRDLRPVGQALLGVGIGGIGDGVGGLGGRGDVRGVGHLDRWRVGVAG